MAKRPYATAYAGVVCGSPTRRWAPPTSASPELQTEMLKKATAVSSDRNEPTTRPCTPRWALELTALFVPLTGPNTAIGASTSAPRTRPTTVAAAPCQNESPNKIGNAPSTLVAKVLAPPKQTRKRSSGRALRSVSGICSTPWVSTSVIDDDAVPAGAVAVTVC